jgi:hypothetical protein
LTFDTHIFYTSVTWLNSSFSNLPGIHHQLIMSGSQISLIFQSLATNSTDTPACVNKTLRRLLSDPSQLILSSGLISVFRRLQ